MKSLLNIFVILFYSLQLFGQSEQQTIVGFRYVPKGTFTMNVVSNNNNQTTSETIAMTSFYMSQEITNKEYREFVEYANANPSKFLTYSQIKRIVVADSISGIKKDSIYSKRTFVKYSQILNDLIDSTILEREVGKYKNYFTDTAYNNYPVVGVSQKAATYYCVWRTETENNLLKQEGKPSIPEYRLPTEEEWAYVASQPEMSKSNKIVYNTLSAVKIGILNLYGLYNFSCNISEWTASFPKTNWSKLTESKEQAIETRIARGGSWKTNQDINLSYELDQNTKTNYIGFRLVRAFQ
ncbi:MAG: SUMF1/EgtB/PvdO family nonheme iron enzyme [Bacteroidales bacterium]|nr:SUMF1/EgtB/PvdO family nonheme iron enzyme [Bacteroidales bacterium]